MEISTLAIIGTLVTIYIRLAIVGRDNKRLRAEMLHGFGALDKKIDTLRTEMKAGDQALAGKIEELRTDMNNGDQALGEKLGV
ncbi:MAG: hypothetical protein F4135_06615, partial [Acidimicrobiia bacterium]|nr:hypothetical protein [Acidimicrobiia bacterium]